MHRNNQVLGKPQRMGDTLRFVKIGGVTFQALRSQVWDIKKEYMEGHPGALLLGPETHPGVKKKKKKRQLIKH